MIWGAVVGAGIVLAVAGVAKLARPAVPTEALRAAGLDVGTGPVTALGALELLAGTAVVVWPIPPLAAVLGLFYLGFTLFAVRLLMVRGPAVSCGCFGQRSAPVGVEHVVVDLAVVVVAVLAALDAGGDTADVTVTVAATMVLFAALAVVPTLRTTGR